MAKENYNKKSKQELVKIVLKRDAEIEKLESEKCKLEKRILTYENAHTPSSLSKKKKRIPRESSGKLGAQKGHKKYEREEPEVTGKQHHTISNCPYCNSKLITVEETRRYIEEELPEINRIDVIEHLIDCCMCDNCGRRFIQKNNVPKERFGSNLRAHITLMKHEDRLPFRKI